MATVIDALLVTLGLDPSGFERGAQRAERAQRSIEGRAIEGAGIIDGQERKTDNLRRQRSTKAEKERLELDRKQREARNKQGKEVEEKAKQAIQGFSKMRNEALSFFAAVVGATGIKGFLENMIGTAAGLDRVSANLGMSAKDLSMWQLANERAGGSAEGMTAQLKDANIEVARYRSGGGITEKMGGLLLWAARVGVAFDPAKLKTGNDLMMVRADVLQALSKQDPGRLLAAAADIGVTEDALPLLKQGSEAVEQLRQAQARLADEMARNAPKAEELRKKLNDLKNEFTTLGVKVLPQLIPYLERFANWLISITPDIEKFAKKVDSAVESLGGWEKVLLAIGALKLLSMAGGLSAIGVALSGIAASFGVIGGVVGVAALATLTGLGLLTASTGLNKGEDEELARRRKMKPTIDVGPQPIATSPARGAQPPGGAGHAGAAALFDGLEKKEGLPVGLLDAVWAQESGRGKNMLSPAGAKGHFQFMDPTAKQYGLKNPNDLNESASAAARMYSDLLKQYGGNLPMALAAYNWGSGNLQRQGFGKAPAETRNYISSITARMGAKNAAAAANMPTGAGAAAASRRGGLGGANTSTTDVKVGQITINTKATDAAGIAASIGPAMTNYGFLAQANAGVN